MGKAVGCTNKSVFVLIGGSSYITVHNTLYFDFTILKSNSSSYLEFGYSPEIGPSGGDKQVHTGEMAVGLLMVNNGNHDM